MKLSDKIEVNPQVSFGKPIIAGTRITVELVLQFLADGWTVSDILEEYPNLKQEDVLACVDYAKNLVGTWKVYPLSSPPVYAAHR